MDFWNENITFVAQRKWKMWIQKNVNIVSKLKLKSKSSSNEEFISEVHWKFPYIYIYLKKIQMTWLL
jgi:hypothetical protein